MPDKQQIATRFSRGARKYDQLTQVQKRMAAQTAASVPLSALPDGAILDIGCGTGELTRHLLNRLPGRPLKAIDLAPGMCDQARSNLAGTAAEVVCADAETAELGGPYALVASSASFQWMHHPFALLKKIRAALKPGGFLTFSTFGPATFAALREAFVEAGQAVGGPHITYQGLDFVSATQWRTELAALFGPENVWSEACLDRNYYPSARDFLKAVSGIGASTPQRGQTSPALLKKMMALYERDHKTQSGVEVIYETFYFRAGPAGNP